MSNNNSHGDFMTSHGVRQNNEMSPGRSGSDVFTLLDQISFGIYSNFWAFLSAMLVIEVLLKIAQNGIQRFLKESPGSRIDSFDKNRKEWKLFNLASENQIKRIFSYAVIFILLQIIGLFSNIALSDGISTRPSHYSALTSDFPQMNLFMDKLDHRILEQEGLDDVQLQNSPPLTAEKISLSMGNILSSLNLNVNAVVLSKDKKTAFATVDFYGTLKIIDISDLQSPLIVSLLSLRVSTDEYRIKTLILSSDEKTLYLSNSKDLEIVDVTDLTSPKLISQTRSQLFGTHYQDTIPSFKTSLAISESTKTLYIGGLGLQVYNISDPKEPVLLRGFKNPIDEDKGTQMNEICLSKDGKILYITNGTLDVYNISNPKKMKKMYSFETESNPRSLLFEEDGKTVFLLGTSEEDEIIIEEADISNLDSFEVKKMHKFERRSDYSPRFIAVSPKKSKIFIFAYESLQGNSNLVVFDRIKETLKEIEENLIEQTFTLDFSLDGKFLITASNNQFLTIELFFDYPNHQIFSPSQENLITKFSFPMCEQMQMSGDGQYLFTLCKMQQNSYFHTLAIWDVKDPSEPKSVYNTQRHIAQMYFLNNHKTVYLIDSETIIVLDIKNRSSIKLKKLYKLGATEKNVIYFIPSSDEKTGFMIRNLGDQTGCLNFVNLPSDDSAKVESFVTLNLNFTMYNTRLILKDNDKTLLVLGQEMIIYDISKISEPRQITLLPFGVNEPDPDLSAHHLSPDGKTLFVETFDENKFFQLKIFNISNLASPQLISEKYFPKLQKGRAQPGLSLSPDLKTGYLFHQTGALIKLNMTNLKEIQVTGVIPLRKMKSGSIASYVLSPDGKTIYAADLNDIRVINTEIEYTLFLKQEKFLLGKKYSDAVSMLSLRDFEYNIMEDDSYKIIKLSLLDTKIAPNKPDLELKTSPLPAWMVFDRESNILTVESKKQQDIGTYTLHSAFSLKIPREVLSDLGTTVPLDDIWAWLISLDYVDPQMYLTENFKGLEEFFLPSNLTRSRTKIYEILERFRVETCTSFEVIPSLELELKDLVAVKTLSTSSIKVEVKLEPGHGVDAKFVNRPYGSLTPVMKDNNQTKISLEGSMKEINTALNSIVVNFENGTSCDANIVTMDGLNPPLSKELIQISSYFKSNSAPSVNSKVDKTAQEQIDSADIQTGKYFTFAFSGDVFEDEYAEKNLNYEVVMADNHEEFPTWLNAHGLTLKGTPPEDIAGRNIDLILIAKNEFKQNQIHFRLHIAISTVFWLKLVLKYCPYILTMIGLLVSANKIFNVLKKDFYKHFKEFYVGVGEEISGDVIFPISFIKEEQKRSEVVWKRLLKDVVDVNDFRIDESIEKEKITMRIKEVIQKMPMNMKKEITPSPIIDQIIINKFVWKQLDSERERKTKQLFEDLKPYCMEVVERDSSGFIVNQNRLNKLITRITIKPVERNISLEESLISDRIDIPEGVSIQLLKDAILAHTFEIHSLDISPLSVDIEIKQRVPSNGLFKFLKLDLREIFIDYKNKMNYGINYQIVDDKLCFYGIAQNYLKGKSLVIQIKNSKHRIMKEIWIHGVSQKDETFMVVRDEQEARGQGYEIY